MKIRVGEKYVELKPCPFCGAEPHIWRRKHLFVIECDRNADVKTPKHVARVVCKTDEEGVSAWNERGNTDNVK